MPNNIVLNEQDQDTPWKEIVEQRFRKFLQFFFAHIYAQIDWHKGYEFLDKELQQIGREADTGRRYVDKLVKVYLKNGKERWILLHIEVQSHYDSTFIERIYIYNYRIYDRYQCKVVSLAVLADSRKNWRPNRFHYELMGCEVSLTFPIIKLLDYQDKWAELVESKNPFAVVVMSHLKALETKGKTLSRYRWKKQLIHMLYERNYEKDDIVPLFKFIDWLVDLPPELQQQLDNEVYDYERSNVMPYVTNIERQGIQKGLQQGLEQGLEQGRLEGLLAEARESVLDNLEVKFGVVPGEIDQLVKQITDIPKLKQLRKQVFQVTSLTQFAQLLA